MTSSLGKLWIQTCWTPFKRWPWVASSTCRGVGCIFVHKFHLICGFYCCFLSFLVESIALPPPSLTFVLTHTYNKSNCTDLISIMFETPAIYGHVSKVRGQVHVIGTNTVALWSWGLKEIQMKQRNRSVNKKGGESQLCND